MYTTVNTLVLNFLRIGGPFGTVLSLPITGWISASYIGWPSAFYIYGAVGICWVAIFLIMGSESPAQHKSISVEERYYIEKSLGHETGHNVSLLAELSIFNILKNKRCAQRPL